MKRPQGLERWSVRQRKLEQIGFSFTTGSLPNITYAFPAFITPDGLKVNLPTGSSFADAILLAERHAAKEPALGYANHDGEMPPGC